MEQTTTGRAWAVSIAWLTLVAIPGCVESKGDSYPLLTRFPDPPKVLTAEEWQRIRHSLASDQEAGVAVRADPHHPSTP